MSAHFLRIKPSQQSAKQATVPYLWANSAIGKADPEPAAALGRHHAGAILLMTDGVGLDFP